MSGLELGYRDHTGATVLYVRVGQDQASHRDVAEFEEELLEYLDDLPFDDDGFTVDPGECWFVRGEHVVSFPPGEYPAHARRGFTLGFTP